MTMGIFSPARRAWVHLRRLRSDCSGLALVEFAASLPFILLISLTGAELTNYASTKMRVSQVALQLADNVARIGNGSLLSNKTVKEMNINDALTGAGLQAGTLDLYDHGRVIVSSVEGETFPTNPSGEYRIRWQRCRGTKVHNSTYGDAGDDNLTGVGPSGRQVTAPDNGAVIFVEVAYDYQPLFTNTVIPNPEIVEVAAMTVRDTRDLAGPTGSTTGIYNDEGVTISSCT